jgi:hypothetical protein
LSRGQKDLGALRRIDKTCGMAGGPWRVGLPVSGSGLQASDAQSAGTEKRYCPAVSHLPFGFQADMMILLSVGLFLIVSTTLAN